MFEKLNYAVKQYNMLICRHVAACGFKVAVCGVKRTNQRSILWRLFERFKALI